MRHFLLNYLRYRDSNQIMIYIDFNRIKGSLIRVTLKYLYTGADYRFLPEGSKIFQATCEKLKQMGAHIFYLHHDLVIFFFLALHSSKTVSPNKHKQELSDNIYLYLPPGST